MEPIARVTRPGLGYFADNAESAADSPDEESFGYLANRSVITLLGAEIASQTAKYLAAFEAAKE